MSDVLMDSGAGMARSRIVAICFTVFFVSSTNESEGTVSFGSSNREIIYIIY